MPLILLELGIFKAMPLFLRLERHIHARRIRPAVTGFTLMELLVVISIIALLASLLMPAIGMVRSAARASACLSNERQMFLGIQLYTSDQEGMLPPVSFSYWDRSDFPLMVAAEYLVITREGINSIRSVLICPADRQPEGYPGGQAWGPDSVRGAIWGGGSDSNPFMNIVQTSYGYNGDAFNAGYYSDIPGHAVPRLSGTVPATTALFWDSNLVRSEVRNRSLFFHNRHQRGVNILLADGSARWYGFPTADVDERWQYENANGCNAFVANWGPVARHLIGPHAGSPWLDSLATSQPTEPWTLVR